MRWFDVAEIVGLNETVIRRMGWSPAPLRDEGGLESAVMRPRMAAQYAEADVVGQAALLAVGISQAQAFIDGNKRTAYAALETFLYLNGVRLTIDPLQIARELERVAESEDRRAAVEAFESWLRAAIDEQA